MAHIRKQQCNACGEPHWFRYWVDERCESARNGLCCTDFDMMLHRFKRVNKGRTIRDVEHIMVVEIKQESERLGAAQRDTLSSFNQAMSMMIPVNGSPIEVESRPSFIIPGSKKIVWHGVHLLRVPRNESPCGPFYWNNRNIDPILLRDILNFDKDPRRPHDRLDIDRTHKAKRQYSLPGFVANRVSEAFDTIRFFWACYMDSRNGRLY